MKEFAAIVQELWNWLYSLDASIVFLLALPFVVGAVALLGEWIRHHRHWHNGGASRPH